jgi:hypothetical protein
MPKRGRSQAPIKDTHNSNAQIGDEAESGPADDFTREPARNKTDYQDDKNAFAGHGFSLLKSNRIRVNPASRLIG